MQSKLYNFALILLTLGTLSQASAQKIFKWNNQKIEVTLPNDFKVVKNTSTDFNCDGDGMSLKMNVFVDGTISADDMKKATMKKARELKFEAKDEMYDVDDDEFTGKYILGYRDGKQYILAGMISKESHTNLWVVISFNDGDEVAMDDGIKILNSIHNF